MATLDNLNLERLERRAKAIAAMGLVNREGGHFTVSSPSVHERGTEFFVSRDECGSVVCTCPAFVEGVRLNEPVRCEHILAVKFALVAKNTEKSVRVSAKGNIDSTSVRSMRIENTKTESRESERGEQTKDHVRVEDPANRQTGSKETVRDRFEDNQGDKKKMKRINPTEAPKQVSEQIVEQIGAQESKDNVLEFSATLRELKKHVDPNLVKQREGWRDRNGHVQMVDYVEWHTVADILDEAAPNWAHTVKDIRQIGDHMIVTVAITIDGVTREGIGTGLAQSEMGIKKAEHDALKRAAVKFGIARELYKKESEAIEQVGSTPPENGDDFPPNPIARSLGDLVTAKQLGMIRAIARELNIDPDEECNSVMHCSTDELTKRAASSLIQHLQDMQQKDSSAAPLRRVS
jgi:hypothetical protein